MFDLMSYPDDSRPYFILDCVDCGTWWLLLGASVTTIKAVFLLMCAPHLQPEHHGAWRGQPIPELLSQLLTTSTEGRCLDKIACISLRVIIFVVIFL